MKDFYKDKPTSVISKDLPDGVIRIDERWITSQPIAFMSGSSCYIRGRFDAIIEFSDATLNYRLQDSDKKRLD
jgi:hypothetical protein